MKKKKKKRGFRVLRVKETFQIGPYKSPPNWPIQEPSPYLAIPSHGQESRAGHVDS